MANRRMFSLDVVDTDLFLDMSQGAQNLYFHLGMRADDDGFVDNPKKIMKVIGSNEDDIKILFSKKFVIPFENGICVIRHWRINNYLRADRYIETQYKQEKKELKVSDTGTYEVGIPDVNQVVYHLDTQDRLGKDSIGKDRLGKERFPNTTQEKNIGKINFPEVVEIYNKLCFSLPCVKTITEKRKTAIKNFLKEFTQEQFAEICEKANNSNFMCGDNDHNWKADFDFLLRIDKATALLEGKYDNKFKKSGNPFLDMLRKEEGNEQGGNDTSNGTIEVGFSEVL